MTVGLFIVLQGSASLERARVSDQHLGGGQSQRGKEVENRHCHLVTHTPPPPRQHQMWGERKSEKSLVSDFKIIKMSRLFVAVSYL